MGTATQGREASGRARRQRAMADPDGGRTTYSYRILPLTPAPSTALRTSSPRSAGRGSSRCGRREQQAPGTSGSRCRRYLISRSIVWPRRIVTLIESTAVASVAPVRASIQVTGRGAWIVFSPSDAACTAT